MVILNNRVSGYLYCQNIKHKKDANFKAYIVVEESYHMYVLGQTVKFQLLVQKT